MFTTADGAPLHPDFLTRRFGRLVQDSGLPAVRLHDLRHGAASLAHCAGADLKTAQEQLGHTSIVLTADTYTSGLHEQHVKAAATAPLVLAAALPGPGHPAAETPCRRAAENSSTASRQADRNPVGAGVPVRRASVGKGAHVRPTKIKGA